MTMTTATKSRPCGCSGAASGSSAPWAARGGGCGCGCSGCGSCGASDPGGCTSGTEEATKRKGPVAQPCLPARARFFPGQLVTDADLRAVVEYGRAEDLLSNAVIGGWGVYCGYSLTLDASSCCICVGPGVAYDAKGRPLVSGGGVSIARPKPSDVDECDPCAPPEDDQVLYLAIAYDDCLDAAKPRYGTPCGPDADPGCDFTRVKERVRFVWIPAEALPDASPYWTSGCLPDPCADPPKRERPKDCDELRKYAAQCEAQLDHCTPCIGLHGGLGVSKYGDALIEHWNLERNAVAVTQGKNPACETCWPGVGALIDVISAVSCEPCGGEALVVLARVTYSHKALYDTSTLNPPGAPAGKAGRSVPTVHVEPLRRRVLSNADLTYVVAWMLRQMLCGDRQRPTAHPVAPPPDTIICEDPCLNEADLIRTLTRICIGEDAAVAIQEYALREFATLVAVERKLTLQSIGFEAFFRIAERAYAQAGRKLAKADVERRYYDSAGLRYQLAAARAALTAFFPEGFPEEHRVWAEETTYAFLRKSRAQTFEDASSIPLFKQLYERIHAAQAPQAELDRVGALLRRTPQEEEYQELKKKADEQAERLADLEAKAQAPAPQSEPPPPHGEEPPEAHEEGRDHPNKPRRKR
jgi:hypothetical protein